MSFFPYAENFVINGGYFATTNANYSTGPTGIDILLEASTPEAAHDSLARDPPPRCFPGTREEYVEDIIHWAIPGVGSTPMPLSWMKGPAGVGKSAVAQTCVEKLKRQGKHCPAFFFSINGRNKHQKFFPSIAYQLATIYPEYQDLIDRKILRHKALVNKTMEVQFRELIVEPLRELEERGNGIGTRIPVFVDGLDECESQDAQCAIVEMVTAAVREGATPLCWAFFSRPESHIEATFSDAGISSLCHMTILPISRDADGDIELYLKDGFKNILRRLNITMDSPWPSDSDMKELVHATCGLFIYAKTVLRFVGQSDSLNPEEELRTIITITSNYDHGDATTKHAFADLDAVYILIMQRIPAKIYPSICRVFVMLCRSNYSSAITIANLLGVSRVELEAACNKMSAILHFQRQHKPLEFDPTINTSRSFLHIDPHHTVETYKTIGHSLGGSISFYHKSFQDFLLDPLRSGTYCIAPIMVDGLVGKQEWKVALHFEKYHHWQGSELVPAPDAPNSASNLSYPHSNELVNSLIGAWIYSHIDSEGALFGADFDFRKHLYVTTNIIRSPFKSQYVSRRHLHQCVGFRKYIGRTILSWLQPSEFLKFNVTTFKENIERQQQRNILWLYYPTPHFPIKPKDQTESALYVIGHGPKSIFWYWEISYDFQHYRELRTLDLAEGERIYREEWSDSKMDDRTDIGRSYSEASHPLVSS